MTEHTDAEIIEFERNGIQAGWNSAKRGWRFDRACKVTSTIYGAHRCYFVDFEQQLGEIDGRQVARIIGKVRDRDLQMEFGPFDVTAAAPAQPEAGCQASG